MTAPDPETRPNERALRQAVDEEAPDLVQRMRAAHPADVAELLEDEEEDLAWVLFSQLPEEFRHEVLQYADDWLKNHLVKRMSPEEILRSAENLPDDELVDLLEHADEGVAEQVLRNLDVETAEELRELSSYDPETAGGLMTTEFVTVTRSARVGDAIKLVKAEAEEVEDGLGVFVVDDAGRPVGYLSDRHLLTKGIHSPVDEAMTTDTFTVGVDTDQEEAANTIQRYGLQALAVVDRTGALVGVIDARDAQWVLEEEATEDMHLLAGTPSMFPTRMPVLQRVQRRMPLMLVTVLGGLATARILEWAMQRASEEASTGLGVSDILRYVPIVVGLAGNVGIQSSTILVRAFATGEVETDQEASVLGSEVLAGSLIGLLCGLATCVIASFLEGGDSPNLVFGAALGVAILIAVSWAGFLGCIIPMGCKRMGIDPAIVAGPFLITLSDVSGSVIFVGIAGAVLKLGTSG